MVFFIAAGAFLGGSAFGALLTGAAIWWLRPKPPVPPVRAPEPSLAIRPPDWDADTVFIDPEDLPPRHPRSS